jgi:HSP20 family protein
MASTLPVRRGGMGSIFADPFRTSESRWDQLMNRLWQEGGPDDGPGSYPVDIDEDEKHIYVAAELPGFTRDEIDVSLQAGVLTISAQRKVEPTERTKHVTERRYTRVQRSFTLPESVDEEKVDAKLDSGVLQITLNKRPDAQRRKITVK